MKMKLIADFDGKRKQGHEMEIDQIRYSTKYAGNFAVRIVGEWLRPRWVAITWFVETSDEDRFRDLVEGNLNRIEMVLIGLEQNVNDTARALTAGRKMAQAFRKWQRVSDTSTGQAFMTAVAELECLLTLPESEEVAEEHCA